MNKIILLSFFLACVGCAIAGYGSGTPGYYDPWTYYGGYDRYYYNRYNYGRNQPMPYYPSSRNDGSGTSYDSRYYNRPRSFYPTSRYNDRGSSGYGGSSGYNRPSYGNGRFSYNRISYDDRLMDEDNYY